MAVSKSHCDKIAQTDGLTLLEICSDEPKKSRERAHLANAGEFNRRYLTCQISAILCADRGDRRKSQSLHRAHQAIFADRSDRRIKSLGVSPALTRGRFVPSLSPFLVYPGSKFSVTCFSEVMLFAGFKSLSLSIFLQLFFQVSENLREAQEWFKTKFGNLQAELVRSRY